MKFDRGQEYVRILTVRGIIFPDYIIDSVFRIRKNQQKKRLFDFWKGSTVVITLCVLGLIFHETHYFASVIGFLIADEVGKKNG